MKKLFWLYILCLLLAACGKKLNDHEKARLAAEEYYGYLIAGDADSYARSIHNYDSLPAEYQTQLCDMFAQYIDDERSLRGGLVTATAIRDTIINEKYAYVFLEVAFGDSTIEQVSLPLVCTGKRWMLK